MIVVIGKKHAKSFFVVVKETKIIFIIKLDRLNFILC
jgi:hypothetical protein